MPINLGNNNRVLPANARAVDVAKRAVAKITDTQNRRYDAAFQVQGYSGILYTKLKNGLACMCRGKAKLFSRLSEDGKMDVGTMNELLSGGQNFGILPYGTKQADTQAYKEETVRWNPSMPAFGIVGSSNSLTPSNTLPSIFSTDSDTPTTIVGSHFDRYGTDNSLDPSVSTVLPQELKGNIVSSSIKGYVDVSGDMESIREEMDVINITEHSDYACPVCFGSGFVGGWSILNGWRKVLVPFDESTAVLDPDTTIEVRDYFPSASIPSGRISWKLSIPKGGVSVDAFKVWNGETIIRPLSILIDGSIINSEHGVLRYCDGAVHTITVLLDSTPEFPISISHVELQINQSLQSANFELPKNTRDGQVDKLDSLLPFQIVLSPLIPLISSSDLIAESTMGKHLLVTEVTDWKTNRRVGLGWEAQVRVAQPQEILTRLPLRKPIQVPKRQPLVIDNAFGNRRT
jgi:hypothetical protein